jgi:ribonuclease Y
MNNWPTEYVFFAGAAIFFTGILFGLWFIRIKDRNARTALAQKEQSIIEAAQRESQTLIREAKVTANEQALQIRADNDQQIAVKHKEIAIIQQRLGEKETAQTLQAQTLTRQEEELRKREAECQKRQVELDQLKLEAQELLTQRRAQLAAISKLNETEVRSAFLKQIEQESIQDAAQISQRLIEEARAKAEDKARAIIVTAIQRYAGNQIFETSTATVNIGNEEMKGRIIGREGRNIRAFEAATGITVLIDDTPGAVVLSGFDPVRREIAREAMERLILDGRIHPARIEEIVTKVSQEIEEVVLRAGEEAVTQVGTAPLHIEVVRLLGRLRFRHSYSQNILHHSIEVAQLAGLLASELGLDVASAKRIGLLHDIGKAVNHEIEGSHAVVGAEILKCHGESETIVNGVASHHGETPCLTPLGALAGAADALSASRPGARAETIMTYIKRVEDLEKLGASFPGVDKCFALQAGRELRVLVQPSNVTDDQAFLMARNIAKKIENDLQYPGQIRVTIVREVRCVEFAK